MATIYAVYLNHMTMQCNINAFFNDITMYFFDLLCLLVQWGTEKSLDSLL